MVSRGVGSELFDFCAQFELCEPVGWERTSAELGAEDVVIAAVLSLSPLWFAASVTPCRKSSAMKAQ